MKYIIQIILEDVIEFHHTMVEYYSNLHGIRSYELLESAVYAPFQSAFGENVYPTIEERAARLGYGIIKNHPFVDGNKRTGTHTMSTFLFVNGYEIDCNDDELENMAVDVANDTMNYERLVLWLQVHLKEIDIEMIIKQE